MSTLASYDPGMFYDELIASDGQPRPGAKLLVDLINSLPQGELIDRQSSIERLLLRMGVTFTVYNDNEGTERIFPFDMIPRIVEYQEWLRIDEGLKQRITALNLFLSDIYGDQKIVKDGVVPDYVIQTGKGFLRPCIGLQPPQGVWCHITGTDLIRDADGTMYVLEDNLRCPSGVSYVLENRHYMKRTFPTVFSASQALPVSDYTSRLRNALSEVAPPNASDPMIVVLTPGSLNSAYYEHSFLARTMGVPLVEGPDLVIDDGFVKMRTTAGLRRVDVIYRRIDDTFLDPTTFRKDSMLGVPGLMDVYRKGRVTIANAPGSGIADDKVVYAYVPKIIKYYLDQDAILPNVPTYVCWDEKERNHVLENLDSYVVKAANEAGGYGMLMGKTATPTERAEFAALIKQHPRNYIAQPTLSLSTVPTLIGDRIEPRHVDLRPFILTGKSMYVLPGGLTRVALREGSLVVNSSQGGGSKDTWVVKA